LANPSAQLPACPPSPSSSPEVFKLPSLPFLGAIAYFYDDLDIGAKKITKDTIQNHREHGRSSLVLHFVI
jgi:hypothetical protein